MTWIALIALVLLWSMARSLSRIEDAIRSIRLTVEIPIYSGDGSDQPEDVIKPEADNVVAFKRRGK